MDQVLSRLETSRSGISTVDSQVYLDELYDILGFNEDLLSLSDLLIFLSGCEVWFSKGHFSNLPFSVESVIQPKQDITAVKLPGEMDVNMFFHKASLIPGVQYEVTSIGQFGTKNFITILSQINMPFLRYVANATNIMAGINVE